MYSDWQGGCAMRRSKRSHSLLAGILAVAMVVSITGLFGASGTTVSITSPASGARVTGPVDIQVSVKTTADVSYILFGIDGTRPSSTNSAPYVFELDSRTLTDGPHKVFAEAYARHGMIGASKPITIYVKNGSASAVPLETQKPATQVVEQPKPRTAPRVATAPATKESPKTVADAAAAQRDASASAAVPGRGPRPEPARTAAQPAASAARPMAPASQTVARAPGEPVAAVPSLPDRPVDRTRGHTVMLNGRPVAFDVAPVITNGRMRVGFRAMFEQVGGAVSWVPETRTAKSVQPALEVEVPIGRRVAKVNGRDADLGMPAVIRSGRTIVPLRFFAETTGSALNWSPETRTASVWERAVAIAERSRAD
jgi:hypothetical protein